MAIPKRTSGEALQSEFEVDGRTAQFFVSSSSAIIVLEEDGSLRWANSAGRQLTRSYNRKQLERDDKVSRLTWGELSIYIRGGAREFADYTSILSKLWHREGSLLVVEPDATLRSASDEALSFFGEEEWNFSTRGQFLHLLPFLPETYGFTSGTNRRIAEVRSVCVGSLCGVCLRPASESLMSFTSRLKEEGFPNPSTKEWAKLRSEGKNDPDIAEMLGVNPSTIRKRKSRLTRHFDVDLSTDELKRAFSHYFYHRN